MVRAMWVNAHKHFTRNGVEAGQVLMGRFQVPCEIALECSRRGIEAKRRTKMLARDGAPKRRIHEQACALTLQRQRRHRLEKTANPVGLTSYCIHGRTQLAFRALQFRTPGRHDRRIGEANTGQYVPRRCIELDHRLTFRVDYIVRASRRPRKGTNDASL